MSLKAICPVKASTKALKAGLQVGIQSAFRHIGSTANCTLNLPLRKRIFFAGNSKLKITRSVKTISQPKRERCSLLVMGSCLNYCNLIWVSTYDSHIEPLLLLQKKVVRIITFSPPLTHTKPLLQKLNILPIHSIFKYQISCFVFYHINKLLPPSLSSLFRFNFEYHNYLTRSRYDIHEHSLKYHFSIHFQVPTIWNNLPLSFRHSLTISNHKRKLKIFYIYE